MNTTRWIAPICLLLVLTLAACGGDEEPTPEPTATPTAAVVPTNTPAPTQPPATNTPAATNTPEPAAEAAESVLPTPEPRAVEMSPLPTPATALVEDACSAELTGQDEQLATQYPVLGCPVAAPTLTQMARQPFQRGQMIWREDTQTVYVLYENGAWQSFADSFVEGDVESDPTLIAPDGTFQPIRGFGKIWREQLGGPGAALGWATLPEGGVNGSTQSWAHGELVSFGLAERFLLFENGSWTQVE